jgi:very-short-patch-repair endonuclease
VSSFENGLAARAPVAVTPTHAEIRLWSRLRRKQLRGFRFRRQHPIGRYVVDFFCPEAKLIVEVDGGQPSQSARDAVRTQWLQERDYRVLRFWDNDVLANTDGVVASILETLGRSSPTRPRPDRLGHPPPQGGRG